MPQFIKKKEDDTWMIWNEIKWNKLSNKMKWLVIFLVVIVINMVEVKNCFQNQAVGIASEI